MAKGTDVSTLAFVNAANVLTQSIKTLEEKIASESDEKTLKALTVQHAATEERLEKIKTAYADFTAFKAKIASIESAFAGIIEIDQVVCYLKQAKDAQSVDLSVLTLKK